jgi:hypothetical protein
MKVFTSSILHYIIIPKVFVGFRQNFVLGLNIKYCQII